MSDEKTLRDTFAAAALTGLIVSMRDESLYEVCESAYGWADAMLRERGTAVSATLTDAEREAIKCAAQQMDNCGWSSASLRAILARLPETSTPPGSRR